MEVNKIPEAQQLFSKLSTYQKMKQMLDAQAINPLRLKLTQSQPTENYVIVDDKEFLDGFTDLVNDAIADVTDKIGQL